MKSAKNKVTIVKDFLFDIFFSYVWTTIFLLYFLSCGILFTDHLFIYFIHIIIPNDIKQAPKSHRPNHRYRFHRLQAWIFASSKLLNERS